MIVRMLSSVEQPNLSTTAIAIGGPHLSAPGAAGHPFLRRGSLKRNCRDEDDHPSEETSDSSRSLADTIQARRKAPSRGARCYSRPCPFNDLRHDQRRTYRSIRIGGAIRYDPKEIADWLRQAVASLLT